MSIRRYKAEQIATVLRQIEVQIANGKTVRPAHQGYHWLKDRVHTFPESPFTSPASDPERGVGSRARGPQREDTPLRGGSLIFTPSNPHAATCSGLLVQDRVGRWDYRRVLAGYRGGSYTTIRSVPSL